MESGKCCLSLKINEHIFREDLKKEEQNSVYTSGVAGAEDSERW